ncbi:MAG: hypothetical protein KDA93_23815 [Planctomycetaceae bacterium]|nr:hypothetical protein [Planctomycetaceae bacterium]
MSVLKQHPDGPRLGLWFVLSLAILANSTGCPKTSYDVEMSTRHGKVERKIVVSDERQPQGVDDAAKQATIEELLLSEAYGTPVERDNNRLLIAGGTFTSQLPNDIGGSGMVHVYRSSLGTLHVYLERFRGSDDLASQVDEITRASNELVDHAHEWVGRECKDPQIAARIHDYLESNGKQDLRNLGLFVWGIQVASSNLTQENLFDDMLSRVMQYALERNYVELDDVPDLMRLDQLDNDASGLAIVRRFSARYLAINVDDIEQVFPAMKSRPTFESSIREVISDEQFASLFHSVFRLRIFGNDDITVRFSLPQEPLWTNGKWVDEEKRLEWKGSIPPREDAKLGVLPTQCFAVWCEPDVDFQQAHFGRVIVDGEELAEYVLWEAALTDNESQEWNTFTETLTPEDDLSESVGEFAFSTTPEMPQVQLMDTPRRVLTSAHD